MMQCITFVTYFVKINGKLSGKITPSKGIRQGDPLSPYLFLICAKSLSALIKKVVYDGTLKGVSICRAGPRLSHLFFANDNIIFYKATIVECETI